MPDPDKSKYFKDYGGFRYNKWSKKELEFVVSELQYEGSLQLPEGVKITQEAVIQICWIWAAQKIREGGPMGAKALAKLLRPAMEELNASIEPEIAAFEKQRALDAREGEASRPKKATMTARKKGGSVKKAE